MGTCSTPPPLLDQVLETGELRVVTRHSPTAYVVGPDGQPSGPEFDLAQAFANELGVQLVIETVQSVSEVLPFMLTGKAHLAAAGLSVTPSRREFVNFGHPYQMVDMHLIYKLGTGKPRSMDEVLGRTIEVVAGTSHVDMLASLQAIYPELNWVENADVEVADLLEKVAAGEIAFTIADSTEFNIQRHFYPDLRVALDLEIGDPLAWAFPRENIGWYIRVASAPSELEPCLAWRVLPVVRSPGFALNPGWVFPQILHRSHCSLPG